MNSLTLRGFSTPQPGNDAIAMAAQYQFSQFGGFAFELAPGGMGGGAGWRLSEV